MQHDKRGDVSLEKADERARGIRPERPCLEREFLKGGKKACLEKAADVRVSGVRVEDQGRQIWEEAMDSMRNDWFGSVTGKKTRGNDNNETAIRRKDFLVKWIHKPVSG